MRWSKSLKVGGTVAAVAAAGLLGNMSPASAEPGAGITTGVSEVRTDNAAGTLPLPPCAHATALTIELTTTGTFMAQTEVFAGSATATFTATEDFWFSPLGIFTDGLCAVPAPVPGTLTVTGTGLSCSGGAQYTRQGANAYAITTLLGSNTCTVNGTTALSSILTFTGDQNPCFGEDFPLPLPDPCAIAPEFVGVYSQL